MDKIRINSKYKPLWTSDAFFFIVTGGRGSGKSFATGDYIENLSFQRGHKVLFTRYTLHSAADSIIPEFEQKISIEGHEGNFYITKKDAVNTSSGSEILFRGLKTASGNQTAKLKSIEGITTWVLEEAEELVEEETFDKLVQSIRKKGTKNRVILVLNPRDKGHWIYKRFFEGAGVPPGFNGEKGNVCYIHTTYFDNLENLSEEFLEEAERAKELTPALYRYQYLGEWVLSVEDAIFKEEALLRYKESNEEGPILVYIDTADEGKDHFAAIFGRLVGKQFFIFDAIYNLHNLTINESICKERFDKWKPDRIYIESNAAGAYFIRNLKRDNPNYLIYGDRAKTNKMGRILAQCGFILERFFFPEVPGEELSDFMNQLCSVTPESKEEDDAADCMAGISQAIRRDYYL